ncbi:hypothetical protein AB0L65_45390 [Nonomuraea sp. NPDC052116]|uniref:hypothetical protein n=1 Tax=Nonomuraea sp. NPDC052116 TaxID=3155665 RepID=UPI00341B5C7D
MSMPTELLAAAAGAIAGTMGTDAYEYARQRVVDLWRRCRGTQAEGEPEILARLDTLQQAVVALEPDHRPLMAKGVQAPVAEILATFVGADQAESLKDLIEALQARDTGSHVVSQQTVTGNIALGNINTAGRDNIIGGTR